MPRRLTFFEQVRGRGESLFLDGGDFLLGTPGTRPPTRADELRAEREARAIIAAYDLCGYHAVGLGPADIQLGVDKLRELVSKARFRTVCTNLVEKESGKPVFDATTVIELGGVRFGIYSVMLDSLNPTYAERVFGSKYALTDPIAATRKAVADLRGRADVVIGLSQLNTDTNERVAAETVGLDYLIDPYAQFGTKPVWITAVPYVIEKEGRATLARIDGQGSRVGVLSLAFEKDRRRKGHAFREYPLEPHIFPHPDMVMLLDRAKRGGAELPTKLRPLADSFYGQETCGGCHAAQLEFWSKTKHAHTFASLDPGGPDGFDKNADCIECHTTGYGVFFKDLARSREFAEVQCESCHGVIPEHPDEPRAHRFGTVSDTRCYGCHNPEITDVPFSYEEERARVACPKMTGD